MFKIKAENLVTKEVESYAVLEKTEKEAKTLFQREFPFHRIKNITVMDTKILPLK